MSEHDSFEPMIPFDFLDQFLSLGNEFGFDPTSSLELEAYCAKLIDEFRVEGGDFVAWARDRMTHDFRSLDIPPRWIQNPAWPVHDGRPMIFVGQIDVAPVRGLLHDSSSFYVFWDPSSGERQTLIQVS